MTTIAVIGAGIIGRTLAVRWAAAGHRVSIANSRGPHTLAGQLAGTGVRPSALDDVTSGADIVVLSVPFDVTTRLAPALSDVSPEVAVVDTGNYVPIYRDTPVAAIEAGLTESVWTAQRLGRPVTKAFNSISGASLRDRADVAGSPGRIALPVAGDRAGDRLRVAELVNAAGFDVVEVESLAASWRQQPGTPVYTTDLSLDAARAALDRATAEDTIAWRRRMRAADPGEAR